MITRSRVLAAAFASVHLLVAATLVPLELPSPLKIAIAGVILASLAWTVCRHALLGLKGSIIALEVRDMQTASFQTRGGVWRDARILGTTYVTPALTAINLRPFGAKFPRHVLLVPDNVRPEDFRQLRVLLRWRHHRHVKGADAAVPF